MGVRDLDLGVKIKSSSSAHLTVFNPDDVARRVRRSENADALAEAWDQTFGRHCDECGHKHARHSPCRNGDDA